MNSFLLGSIFGCAVGGLTTIIMNGTWATEIMLLVLVAITALHAHVKEGLVVSLRSKWRQSFLEKHDKP